MKNKNNFAITQEALHIHIHAHAFVFLQPKTHSLSISKNRGLFSLDIFKRIFYMPVQILGIQKFEKISPRAEVTTLGMSNCMQN